MLSPYLIDWSVLYNDDNVMKKIYSFNRFKYHEKNALCIEKLNEKVETRDIILHSRLVIVKSNNSKDAANTSIDDAKE